MPIAFATEVVSDLGSLVEQVFARPIALRNESETEAKVPTGQVTLIANYRGYTFDSNRGRKARGAGEAVIDLSAVSRVPARELKALIQNLQELEKNLDQGIAQAESLSGEPDDGAEKEQAPTTTAQADHGKPGRGGHKPQAAMAGTSHGTGARAR